MGRDDGRFPRRRSEELHVFYGECRSVDPAGNHFSNTTGRSGRPHRVSGVGRVRLSGTAWPKGWRDQMWETGGYSVNLFKESRGQGRPPVSRFGCQPVELPKDVSLSRGLARLN